MKSVWILLALFPILQSCGGDDNKTTTSAVDANTPDVAVPANANKSDYSCVIVREYTDARGEPRHHEYVEEGTQRYWLDGGYVLTYDELSDGTYKSLAKYLRQNLENGEYRLTENFTSWEKTNGTWTKKVEQIDRLWQKNGGQRHVLENRVNGVDTPYYWDYEDTRVDDKTTRTVQRHRQPSVLDHDGLHYTKDEHTCTYIDL